MAWADSPADDPGSAEDNPVVASAAPGVAITPDGWILTVAASNESQLPATPLSTAASSREYVVAGTFIGTISGHGTTELTGGILEAGYQIGCGIELKSVQPRGDIGVSASGSAIPGANLLPTRVSVPIVGVIMVHLRPGTVSTVTVDAKTFKAAPVRVTVKDVHITVDGCVGQSFIRSYATLKSSTTDTDDLAAYYGVTKAV
ncbi:MspA family porin [Mycobacterium sp. CBMA226]|nr:MspA family porin [Mycolicibacterium sp. CBMA 226]MUL77022.1 MspA family porin [Mycolicibacterium sp. CBMA 226]